MGWMFGPAPRLLAPEKALAGGNHPVLPHPRAHMVLGTPITGPWEEGQAVVYIGIGCFWGAEKMFWETKGVVSTSVGYAGGVTKNPTYREVCTGRTNHTEVVEVVFDPNVITLEEIVVKALEAHDPTQGFRQGNDVGTQYRSAFYTATEQDARRVQAVVDHYAPRLQEAGFGPMTTEVAALSETVSGQYYLAEDEHQQYLHKNPGGYCPHHSTGVACGLPQ
ncbi:Peptide methionine sulfoxide reductase [Corynebacterium kutscheri]|uniref:Peptide methionine sulfoxide reductase MsrA n=1 Tax=Corynebacterium kutscheri TaxID=35755 RepID=A0A0F6R175_9CORY|nr:peptide-methionine (S)-S-oxide reductase MsrA [Corynebacterium kutscheri]AKE42162.1 methionine-S-sulfoxide reductase [Corynebacterium kutscheri]VEH05852.1 Peptide methionine sulfoxide reductase [Corynebacterium kutscheri]VEH10505.1 Peptide methionine sulfoxide reductase [Corynebacterium kutscheri]VEH81746.1 Peptide methionine sulfoxide reductase [Corynebacterium kutscheri]